MVRAIFCKVFSHPELMTHSLLGRSGGLDHETNTHKVFPPVDKLRREAVIGKVI